ncbi:TonB-dependent receptor [Thalassomonas sp. RHCl1]|uniref:TonB-dependent receptor n=1 Tax=Thalassomonas sp. RHCl1 TaxID=2995320 RepID=UPI00248C1337|nr:TonB-dependent receptor [Thalassomonas sp. RHCl1]
MYTCSLTDKKNRYLWFLLLLTVLLAVNFLTLADETSPELETITITAQKRQQTLQEVPVAVSNFWGEELGRFRVFDALELTYLTPGFSAGEFNVGQPQFFIRGIGSNEDGAGGDNAVVVNADGVPVGRAAGSLFDFYDLERIEVLRGPQGSLYGKNATGGVINVISALPEEESRKDVQLALGNDGILALNCYWGGALDDEGQYLGSLSLFHRQRDGVVNSGYGHEQSDINDSGIKGQLYLPHSPYHWRLIGEYSWLRREGAGRHAVEGAIGAAIEQTSLKAAHSPYYNLSGYDGFQNRDTYALTLQFDNTLSWGDLHGVSGYRKTDMASSIDQQGLSEQEGLLAAVFGRPVAGTNDVREKSWQFSQELRLSLERESWFFLAGLFYFHEDIERLETFNFNPDSFSFQDNVTNSFALFSETTFSVSKALSLTVGGRFSRDKKHIHQSSIPGLLIISTQYREKAEKSWGKFTPRMIIDYWPNPGLHTYFSVSTGYKSGGYQGQAPNAMAARTPFDEENVLAYELGFKWHSPGGDARLYAAFFHMAYDDLQVLQLVDDPNDPNDIGVIVTENAADAISKGLELEWQLMLADHWQLRGNYGYLDASFEEFISTQGNFADNRLRNSPKHAAALSLTYQRMLSSGAELNISYSHSYSEIRYQDPANIKVSAVPAFDLANLDVSYHEPDSRWVLGFWIDNIWDESYFIHGFPTLGGGILTPAPDRNAGLSVRYQF